MLDWNAIQSMSNKHDPFAGRCCVIPETLALELTGKSEERRPGLARKLQNWINSTKAMLLAGQNPFWLLRSQYRFGGGIRASDLVDRLSTWALRRFNSFDLGKRIAETDDSPRTKGMTELQQSWVASCERFGTNFQEAWKTDAELRKHVNDKKLFASLLNNYRYARWASRAYPRLCRPEWSSQMNMHPNRFAFSRWGKLCLYYSLCRVSGSAQNFENNFDDAQYVLLASYTGHLVTSDAGAIRAASICFPALRVWSPAANPL